MKIVFTAISFVFCAIIYSQIQPDFTDKWEMMDSLYVNGRAGYVADFCMMIDYPEGIKKEKVFGRVYFEATIDTLGNISSIELLRGIDPRLDKTAIDTFNNTNGNWKVLLNEQGQKMAYKFIENVYFELR